MAKEGNSSNSQTYDAGIMFDGQASGTIYNQIEVITPGSCYMFFDD